MENHTPKILILHDYFLYKGGGERLVISLAKNLGADIATAFVAKDAFDPRMHDIKTFELFKETLWTKIPGFRYVQVQMAFLLKTGFIKNYDIIIYSGDSLIAMVRLWWRKNIRHIAYMHTPPRHLYDAYRERLREYALWKKIIFVPFATFNRWRFKFLSSRLDLIITNSKNTQARIKKYLGLDSVVVYPPCDTLPFRNLLDNSCHSDDTFALLSVNSGGISVQSSNPPLPRPSGECGQRSLVGYGLARDDNKKQLPFAPGEYFFSWARLYPIKRVDKIVEAFIGMPDKKLVVASGGPELKKIKKMAHGHANIQVLGWISDEQLINYLGNCLATIYIPIREDFGMSAVESMQAGKPVIGVAEGGLLEIINDNKNGMLLKPDFTVNDLRTAVRQITLKRALTMENACYETAKKFSEQAFIEGMKKTIFK